MGVITNVQKLFKRNRFIGFGIPFLVLLVGGSFALKQFTQLRYTFRRKKLLTPEEAEVVGAKLKPPDEKPTLEREYEKLQEMNLDTWENIRGYRPWEKSDQTDQRKT